MAIPSRAVGFVIVALVWGGVVASGFAMLAVYGNTPGQIGEPPELNHVEFAEEILSSKIIRTPYRMVMAIHPKCPCTRSTMAELERLITKSRQSLACTILVYRPALAAEDWHKTSIVRTARKLPMTEVLLDEAGEYAKAMRLKTSGAAVVYGQNGQPLFWGGITVSRGHEGDNLGSDAIISLIRSGKADRKSCSVFGCPLERPESANDQPTS